MSQTNSYRLTLPQAQPEIMTEHLMLGGRNASGQDIAFTNYYMMQNGEPCIPVMGEFHFSRYDHRYWADELLKIKAGGVNILATYVFWNHIEEDQGVYDWTGNKNLRHFIELCQRQGLQVLVRVGPFAHGECRNGGLPDWLYGQPFPLRSNDPRYLAHVERWYQAIEEQLRGLLFKDDGPIIGLQLDNEYMHCGAPWEVTFRQGTEWVPAGSEGAAHMAALKDIAMKVGLDVPIYTATGWLRSPIIEDALLPMQGGYAFTPWSPDPNYQQEPTREFLFRNRHLHPVLNGDPTYDAQRYPYACCEIGGGIQITYYHRPIVPPQAVEALCMVNIAGGANIVGYYMYHGGTNPIGKHSFMNEFTVPRLSYDFQAPIREFGQIADSYRHLRLLHLFLQDFGSLLAPMYVTLPEDQARIEPEDTGKLRYMLRSTGDSGFIFLNNYQDHVTMQDLTDLHFEVKTSRETLHIPHTDALTLQKDVSAILPIGLDMHGIYLKYATTQLLCKLDDDNLFVFFAPHGMLSEYAFERSSYDELTVSHGSVTEAAGTTYVRVTPGNDCIISLKTLTGDNISILTLTREQAEICNKLHLWGRERLILSQATVTAEDGECILYCIGNQEMTLAVYPAVESDLTVAGEALPERIEALFTHYAINLPQNEMALAVEKVAPGKVVVPLGDYASEDIYNLILQIDYVGDMGNAYIDGQLVHDHFYNGLPWEIGVRQILRGAKEVLLLITPAYPNSGGQRFVPTGMAFRPDDDTEAIAEIQDIRLVPEFKIQIKSSE